MDEFDAPIITGSLSNQSPAQAAAVSRIKEQPKPWVTIAAIAICVLIFVGINSEKANSWDALSKWGYLPAARIWSGSYWGFVTNGFVHIAPWHLAFNMYWLWFLGGRMELAIGWWRYLLFVVVATFVSSASEVAIAGVNGIGASGFVYAIFGFMWIARDRFPSFRAILTPQLIKGFLVWLVGCIVATYLDILQVANAAHFFGLLFGVLVAYAFVAPRWQLAARGGLAALIACSIVPLFWCPWSNQWLSQQAYQAHLARDHHRALDLYSRVLSSDSNDAWALYNRSLVYRELGQPDEADADEKDALRIDPSIKDP